MSASLPVLGPIFQGVGAIASGAGSIASTQAMERQAHYNRAFQERYNNLAQQNFDKVLNTSVERRVADAKRAGIAPLAALGAPGAQLPAFQVNNTRGGPETSLSGVGEMLSGVGQAAASIQNRRDRKRERIADRASRLQLEQHRNVIHEQRLRIAERALKLHGMTAVAQHQAGVGPKKMPIYVRGYDNRPGEAPLGEGEYWFMDPELAESTDNMGALLIGGTGNILGDHTRGYNAYNQGGHRTFKGMWKDMTKNLSRPKVLRRKGPPPSMWDLGY